MVRAPTSDAGDLWTPGLGWPSTLLRLIAIAFWGPFRSLSVRYYEAVKGVEVLQNGPYNPNIVPALRMAAKWGSFGYIWNVVALVPSLCLPTFMIILIGGVDLALAVLVGISVLRLEAQFIPSGKSPCDRAFMWQLPYDGVTTESIFEVIGRHLDPPLTSRTLCRQFVNHRRWGTGAFALYCIISAFHVGLGLVIVVYALVKPRPRKHLVSIAVWPSVILYVIGTAIIAVMYGIPLMIAGGCLYQLVPQGVRRAIRFARTYAAAFYRGSPLRLKAGVEYFLRYMTCQIPLRPIPERWARRWYAWRSSRGRKSAASPDGGEDVELLLSTTHSTTTISPLETCMNVDILFLVSKHLHYRDLVNLSRTSKTLRGLIFPAKKSLLDKYTCRGAERTRCWACFLPTCSGCSTTVSRTFRAEQAHLDRCAVHCSKCVYRSANLGKICQCHRSITQQQQQRRQRRQNQQQQQQQQQQQDVPSTIIIALCDLCKDRPGHNLLCTLAATEAQVYRKTVIPRLDRCDRCGAQLRARGPRFWVCGKCGCECRGTVHPSWC